MESYNKRKSLMWDFFERNVEASQVKCKTCGADFKYSNNTTNMKDHLQRKHPELLITATNSQNNGTHENVETNNIQKNVGTYNINSTRKKMLDTKFAKMIAIDMEPLRLAEREGLKEFVKALDSRYVMPGRTSLSTKLIPRMYMQMKVQLMDVLTKISNIAITADTWTSISNQGILGITCHFILSNCLESTLLAAVVVEGHHDADSLSSVIASVLDDWQCREKVVALVTDSAPTMIKVAEILKLRHIPCFAHSLNTVIKHTINECTALTDLMTKCKTIVSFFKHSTLASDKLKVIQRNLKKPELKLVQHVETRWNSTLEMFRRIDEMKDELTLAISQNPRAPPNLAADEYIFLKEVETIFEPVLSCTEAVSGETYATLSLIIPLIKGLLLRVAQIEKESMTESGKTVLEAFKKCITTKIKPYEKRSPCIIATLLNPHFKKQGFKTDAEVKIAFDFVQKEYSAYLIAKNNNIPSSETNEPERLSISSETDVPAKKPRLNLLSFLDAPPQQHSSNATADAIIDLRQYVSKPILARNEYPIEYWTYNHTSLKNIALKYMCIPGTSTPAERIFSKAGQIIVERRNRLSGKHINELLFIKQNYKLLEK